MTDELAWSQTYNVRFCGTETLCDGLQVVIGLDDVLFANNDFVILLQKAIR